MRISSKLAKEIRSNVAPNLIVTPLYEKWLLEHHDDPLPDWVIRRVQEVLSTPPRSRVGSFGGSSAGKCLRRQELAFLGAPQPVVTTPSTNHIFHDGNCRHLRWQASLLAAGIISDIEFSFHVKNKRARGSLDGIGIVASNHPNRDWRGLSFGLEIKGANSWAYNAHAETWWKDYADQVPRYYRISGVDLYVILMENKDTQEYKEVVLTADQMRVRFKDDEAELDALNHAIGKKRLHPMLSMCKAGSGEIWERCPFGGKWGPCANVADWPTKRTLETWGDTGKKATQSTPRRTIARRAP